MPFMGRGGGPSLNHNTPNMGVNNIAGNVDENSSNNQVREPYYRSRIWRLYIIPLDNTYVIMQMIMFFILLVAAFLFFIFARKSAVTDTIENVKNIFINSYLIVMALIFALTAFAYRNKEKRNRMIMLIAVLVLSLITMFGFFFVRLSFDSKYNNQYFDSVYISEHPEENTTKDNAKDSFKKQRVDLTLAGPQLKTDAEFYTSECMEMYNIFKVKTYLISGSHLLINILLVLQIIKLMNIDKKREQLEKDDAIVYDPEQNVHF
jgi:hypothetical protein